MGDRFQSPLAAAEIAERRIHDLHHTAATLLLEAGVHPRLVQGIMGHSNIWQTMAYSHARDWMQEEASDKLNALLNPVDGDAAGAKRTS